MKLKPRESEEKIQELVERLHDYDAKSEVMTPTKARDLVQRSGMLLVLRRWDLEQEFMLDQRGGMLLVLEGRI